MSTEPRKLDNFIWYEKYRPMSLAAMSLNENTKRDFEQYIEQKDFPHLLLTGVQGSGKTTLARVLTGALGCTVLELNASSKDRGIETVRTKIPAFAMAATSDGSMKVVFLDEADCMTADAQTALRNTIEKYSNSCRFILTANHADQIIPALKSRCIHYKFSQFPKEDLLKLLGGILQKEGIKTKRAYVEELINTHYPDIRTIINELQRACLSGEYEVNNTYGKVNKEKILNYILDGRLFDLRDALADVTEYSWLYRMLYDDLMTTYGDEFQKRSLAITIAKYMHEDMNSPDKEITFAACVAEIMEIFDIAASF